MKKQKQIMDTMEKQIEFERIGRDIKSQLDSHYKQWECGLPYKTLISKYAIQAKKIGLGLNEMANFLEEAQYLKITATPTGKRFVFSGDCEWTKEEMQSWLQDQEMFEETQREFRKANRI